ncbi:RNA polymerase sigma factor [Planctomycetota bacterium]
MTSIDIGQLVTSARGGDREAYAGLIRQHYKQVFLTCMGVLGNQHDAEDLTQEVFVKGMIQLGSLRDDSQFGAWISRIARNICINQIRKKKVSQRYMDKTSLQSEGKPATHRIDVERAVAKLPEDLRLPLVMYYFDGQDVKQVAKRLEMSASSVYQRLRNALTQLHAVLAESGDVS